MGTGRFTFEQLSCPQPIISSNKGENKVTKNIKLSLNKKNESGGKIIFWNKGNALFVTKKDEVEVCLSEHKPLCIGICEANIEADCHLPSLVIDGYNVELDGLHKEGFRGRAMIYIKEGAQYARRTDLEPPLSPSLWVEFNPGSKKAWLLNVGYREWRSLVDKDKTFSISTKAQLTRLSSWETSWTKAESEGKPMIIGGDFNVDVSYWNGQYENASDYRKTKKTVLSKFKEMGTLLNLELIKTPPTRFQRSSIPSTLDVIFTNKPELISTPVLISSSSDHKMIIVTKTGKVVPEQLNVIYARSYKKYTCATMLKCLEMPFINKLMWNDNPEEVADHLVASINRSLDIVAPFKKTQIRKHYAPSISEATKILMKERDLAKTTFITSQMNEDKIKYNKIRNLVLKKQRKDKSQWIAKMLGGDETNAKKIWQTVKTVSGDNKRNTVNKIIIDGEVIAKPSDIVEGLNEAFIKKVTDLKKNMPVPEVDLLSELKSIPTPVDKPVKTC